MENKDKKSLDKYFVLAKKEKVEYSKEDTKKLLVKYSSAGTLGLLSSWWLKSLFNLKFLGLATGLAITSFTIYYSFFHNKNVHTDFDNNYKYPVSSNMVSDSVSNSEKNKNNAIEKVEFNDALFANNNPETKAKTNALKSLNSAYKDDDDFNSHKVKNVNSINADNDLNSKSENKLNNKSDNNLINNSNNYDNPNESTNEEAGYDDDIKQNNSIGYYGIGESRYKGISNINTINLFSSRIPNKIILYPRYEADPDELKTLMNDFATTNSYTVTGLCKYSKVLGNDAILVGGKVLWTMNDRISIGITGYGNASSTKNKFTFTDYKNESITGNLSYWYGALALEYKINPDDFIKLGIMSNIGMGSYKMVIPSDNGSTATTDVSTPWATLWLLEPGINMEIEVHNFFRIGGEVSYRFSSVFQSERKFNSSSELRSVDKNAISAGIFIKIGLF